MPQYGTDPPRSQHGLRAQTDTEAKYLTVHRLHQFKIGKRGQSRLEFARITHAVQLGAPCGRVFPLIQETKPRGCEVETVLSSARHRRIGEGKKRCAPVRGGPQGNEEGVEMVPGTNQHTCSSLLTSQTLATQHNMYTVSLKELHCANLNAVVKKLLSESC
jgi:hypothetical protein